MTKTYDVSLYVTGCGCTVEYDGEGEPTLKQIQHLVNSEGHMDGVCFEWYVDSFVEEGANPSVAETWYLSLFDEQEQWSSVIECSSEHAALKWLYNYVKKNHGDEPGVKAVFDRADGDVSLLATVAALEAGIKWVVTDNLQRACRRLRRCLRQRTALYAKTLERLQHIRGK